VREPSQKTLRKLERVMFKCPSCQPSGENKQVKKESVSFTYQEYIKHLALKCPSALVRCPKECQTLILLKDEL
jgi:uncharacterized Zn finger protein